MRLTILSLVTPLAALCIASSSAAQTSDDLRVDPTAESPQVRTQIDAVRDIEQLEGLRRDNRELQRELQDARRDAEQQRAQQQREIDGLKRQLEEMQTQADQRQIELDRAETEAARRQAMRASVPQFSVGALVTVGDVTRGLLVAGDRSYRFVEGRRMRLAVGDGEALEVSINRIDDHSFEIRFDELDLIRTASYFPAG